MDSKIIFSQHMVVWSQNRACACTRERALVPSQRPTKQYLFETWLEWLKTKSKTKQVQVHAPDQAVASLSLPLDAV